MPRALTAVLRPRASVSGSPAHCPDAAASPLAPAPGSPPRRALPTGANNTHLTPWDADKQAIPERETAALVFRHSMCFERRVLWRHGLLAVRACPPPRALLPAVAPGGPGCMGCGTAGHK